MDNHKHGGGKKRIDCCVKRILYQCEFSDALGGKEICVNYIDENWKVGCDYYSHGRCLSQLAQRFSRQEKCSWDNGEDAEKENEK